MRGNFDTKKNLILALLALLISADVGLGVYAWRLGTVHSAQQELTAMTLNRDLLRKDIQRAQDIRGHIPDIQKDCAVFEQSFLPANTYSSTVTSDLTSIADKSGLRLDNRSFKESTVKGQSHLTELTIDAQLTGDYRSVVRFLNALQRWQTYYSVDDLSAESAAKKGGAKDLLRVKMHIKTYVRAA